MEIELKFPPELLATLDQINAKMDDLKARLDDQEPFVNTAEAARILGVNKDTVRRRAREGRIPCERLGGKNFRFKRADLIEL